MTGTLITDFNSITFDACFGSSCFESGDKITIPRVVDLSFFQVDLIDYEWMQ